MQCLNPNSRRELTLRGKFEVFGTISRCNAGLEAIIEAVEPTSSNLEAKANKLFNCLSNNNTPSHLLHPTDWPGECHQSRHISLDFVIENLMKIPPLVEVGC
jgi:hypothetical protein